MLFVRSMVAVLLASTLSGPAFGQRFLFSIDDIGLTNEDYEIIRDEAATLYTANSPTVGSETEWSNPETKSHGKIELTEFDGRCAKLKHLFRVGKTKKVYEFVSRRCESESGEWLLAPK